MRRVRQPNASGTGDLRPDCDACVVVRRACAISGRGDACVSFGEVLMGRFHPIEERKGTSSFKYLSGSVTHASDASDASSSVNQR